jgi:PBP1b-binding outer membrane lipoprotein LpoB
MKTKSSLLILLVLALTLAGCQPAQPAGLSNDQVAQVTANILQAIDAGDYTAFTRDFSAQMNAAFTQAQFDHLRTTLQQASGKYISQTSTSLSNNQGYAVYHIVCKYEKEDVAVTITFLTGGDKVEGLFLTSVNLVKLSK